MIKKIYSLLSAIIVCLTLSCNQQSAINYNDTVVDLYEHYSDQVSTVIDDYADGGELTSTLEKIIGLEILSDSCIQVMQNLKPAKEAENFHQETTKLYHLVKTNLIPQLRELIKLEETESSDELYNRKIDDLNQTIDAIEEQENKAIAAQEDFSKHSNLKIEN